MRKIAALLFCFLPTLCAGSASADGLFGGKRGIIRGSVGNFLDKNVEKPILTPLAQKTTVGVTTTVGTAIGGPIGGVVGEYVGETINERAAGKSPPIGRPYKYAAATPATPNEAGSVLFRVTNSGEYKMRLRFYSSSRSVTWPSVSNSYVLADSNEHQYPITCQVGERVCYGAYYENGSTYWGKGRDITRACTDCCLTCSTQQTATSLNLGD